VRGCGAAGAGEALRTSVRRAPPAVVGLTALLGLPASLVAALAVEWLQVGGGAVLLGPLLGSAIAPLAVRLVARRARRIARQLPDSEAAAIVAPLARSGNDRARAVARHVLRALHPQGTELLPATAPDGRGGEVAPESSSPPAFPFA
jgi:hypothetical protein